MPFSNLQHHNSIFSKEVVIKLTLYDLELTAIKAIHIFKLSGKGEDNISELAKNIIHPGGFCGKRYLKAY